MEYTNGMGTQVATCRAARSMNEKRMEYKKFVLRME